MSKINIIFNLFRLDLKKSNCWFYFWDIMFIVIKNIHNLVYI